MLNLPNLLTLIRIAAIPLFLILLSSRFYTASLVIFIIGGITDALDGPVARLTNQRTRLGTYLDPLADKLLIVSSLLVLSFIGAVPTWLTILVVSRDLIVTIGYGTVYFLVQERMEIQPSAIGKLNTFLLLLLVTLVLVSLYNAEIVHQSAITALVYLTAITTVVSGLHYVHRGLVWFQERAPSLTRSS